MVVFVYRKVTKDGEVILLPKLQLEVERTFPDHQQFISAVLSKYGMGNWKVVFYPHQRNKGLIAIPLELLFISSHRRKEMIITLYHEVIHYLHRDWGRNKERQIDRMAVHWYVTGELPSPSPE